MKIVFLCGSLQPGQDGVGDYTRRLAVELIKQGHAVSAIALNDNYVETVLKEQQFLDDFNLPVLRLPSDWKREGNFEAAKEWITSFNPDFISLQFVIYSFHPKGLPFGIIKFLSGIGKGRKWEIMFHELWVGMSIGSSKKNIAIGFIQKILIKNLITALKPSVIHTQTGIYLFLLRKMGFNTAYLSLFSNIPVKSIINKNKPENKIALVIFGSIHPGSPIDNFSEEVANYSLQKNIAVEFVFIGRSGKELDHWVSACESRGLKTVLLGEQNTERISEVLANSTIGISANEVSFVEKSGTVAAMLEHGLPVICISNRWIAREAPGLKLSPPKGVMQYEFGKIEMCLEKREKPTEQANVTKTSILFIDGLKPFLNN